MSLNYMNGFATWNSIGGELTAATHWRFLATAMTYNPSGYVEIIRLSLYAMADATGYDAALSGSASASSSYPGYPPSNAFDANEATRWASGAPPAEGQWLAIQFAAPIAVRSLVLTAYYPSSANIPSAAKLQCSDNGAVWKDIAHIAASNTGSPQSFVNLQ